MHAAHRAGESGFSLIELLCVMIIIAALMAIAYPTYAAQKETARSNDAKQNLRIIVNAVETCAVNNTDGEIRSPAGIDCTNVNVLKSMEPTLAQPPFGSHLRNGDNVNGTLIPGYDEYVVDPMPLWGSNRSYHVLTAIRSPRGSNAYQYQFFQHIYYPDGTVTKVCTVSPVCMTGKW